MSLASDYLASQFTLGSWELGEGTEGKIWTLIWKHLVQVTAAPEIGSPEAHTVQFIFLQVLGAAGNPSPPWTVVCLITSGVA